MSRRGLSSRSPACASLKAPSHTDISARAARGLSAATDRAGHLPIGPDDHYVGVWRVRKAVVRMTVMPGFMTPAV